MSNFFTTNNIYEHIYGSIFAYADDTALIFHAKTWRDVYVSAQQGFNAVSSWLAGNLLTVNVDKTIYINFSMNLAGQPLVDMYSIRAHSCSLCPDLHGDCTCPSLKCTKCVKYLGVMIDFRLTFQHHINTLSARLRKIIFVLKRLRYISDIKVIRLVYTGLCQSVMAYCIETWGGTDKTSLIILERTQRALLKVG